MQYFVILGGGKCSLNLIVEKCFPLVLDTYVNVSEIN